MAAVEVFTVRSRTFEHVVATHFKVGDNALWHDFHRWMNSSAAKGEFGMQWAERVLSFRFSDADTAFAFKMRFG